jgi:2-C-methyl-D-erythritol 4-phosphate cytidylyltransferase
MSVIAIVVGAGRGERLGGDLPKALVPLRGERMLDRSACALGAAPSVTAVQLVLPHEHLRAGEELASRWNVAARLLPAVAGGATRQASVARGLEAARKQGAEWVLVHDAARCLVQPSDAEQVLDAARATGAALPVAPVLDTVKSLSEGRVVATLERAGLGLALTPQAFRADLLAEALALAAREGFEGTDCASLVERLGVEVRAIEGRPDNFKVTRPEDVQRAEVLLAAREAES